MGQEITKIKKRIKSVSSAYKVTSAMKLVSTVKLKKWKNKMLAFREYANQIDEVKKMVLLCSNKVTSQYFEKNNSTRNLYIVVSSSLGLCGSYNNNIFKLANVSLKETDSAIILGSKGIAHFDNGDFDKIEDFSSYTSSQDEKIVNSLALYIMNEYEKGSFNEIHIIYSEYKNSLVFLPKDYKILPLEKENNQGTGFEPILEPNPQALVETLIPMYIKTIIHSKLLESDVCEQAARSNAMESATKNAEELLSDLKIEFNKARQGAITQEITEIVGAAEAL